jgi:intracellular sulfur oxidation DsrE/DsrF family protein
LAKRAYDVSTTTREDLMTPLKATLLAATLALSPLAALAEGKTHYLAIHVDESDRQKLNMALNNAQNVQNYYKAQGDEVVIEIVAYGPGLQMYVEGQSPVADRIKAMALESDDITFAACGNTLEKMSKNAGKDLTLLEEAVVVPSGVVRLMELQQDGYAYVRP